MKNKYIVLALGLASTLSFADSYFGVSYAPIDYSSFFYKSNPKAAVLTYGVKLNDVLDIQGRYGLQLRDDSGFHVELEKLYGAYLVAKLPNESIVKPYGVIGYTEIYLKGASVFDELSAESNVSYGLGIDFEFTENSALSFEYVSYVNDDDVEITSLSLGYKGRF